MQDHFAPLPGFEIHYLYDDFSTPCFDGWHTEIMGGSWVSTGDQASSFARYHFRRHFFQHLGFRYVAVDAKLPEAYPGCATVANLWEGMEIVSNEVTNAFAKPADRMRFPPALVDVSNSLSYNTNMACYISKVFATHSSGKCDTETKYDALSLGSAKVLHLGCGVGGLTMELAKVGFGKVVGVDAREPVIRQARVIQHHGQLEYERVEEGVLTAKAFVKITAGSERVRAVYLQEDPAALSVDALSHGPFNVVVVDDIVCSQVQPLHLLRKLHEYVAPGGICIIACGNDWDSKLTPRNSWVGGFKMNGEDMSTLHMLQYHLKKHFEHLETADIPKMTRQHARKFILNVLETSVWRSLRC